jgi:protein SCO1/2
VSARVAIALSVAAALALGGLVLASSVDHERGPGPSRPAFAGSLLPPGVRAPDFALGNQDGDEIRMHGLRGRPVIVTFLYTHCDESCPPQAQQIKGALAELRRDVPALAIAVEPPRDTPESARHFLREQRMAGLLDFILGSREELRPLWKGYAIQPQSARVEHQARIVLVDKRGFQRVAYPLREATPERIAHDIRLLQGE